MPIDTRGFDSGASPFLYVVAILAASLLVIASTGFGAYFAWSLNATHAGPIAYFAVAMAIGLEVAKPVAVHGLFRALGSWRFGQAAALSVLAIVAIGYSLTAELQLMARARSDALADRMHASGATIDVRGRLAGLKGELAAVGPARPAAELEALAGPKAAAVRGIDCTAPVDAKQRSACNDFATFRAEQARAAARAELRERIEAAEHDVATAGAPRSIDPAAQAFASYLAAFGVHVEPNRIGDWFTLVSVLALEAGSMFAAVLVTACRPNVSASAKPGVQSDVPPAHTMNIPIAAEMPALPAPDSAEPCATETPVERVQDTGARLVVADQPAERLIQLLTDRGGEVISSQRTLAAAIGVSSGRVNALLRDLSDARRIEVQTDSRGTRIRLAA